LERGLSVSSIRAAENLGQCSDKQQWANDESGRQMNDILTTIVTPSNNASSHDK